MFTSSSIQNLYLRSSIQACQVQKYYNAHHPSMFANLYVYEAIEGHRLQKLKLAPKH